ncbi:MULTISPECIES: hypothetical protein [unclassified Croceitalea]|uniref:hypothetical protein n=1 Tax=unclassified Croceitalea TaxID=2632280 RepID=UPI0030DB45FA
MDKGARLPIWTRSQGGKEYSSLNTVSCKSPAPSSPRWHYIATYHNILFDTST